MYYARRQWVVCNLLRDSWFTLFVFIGIKLQTRGYLLTLKLSTHYPWPQPVSTCPKWHPCPRAMVMAPVSTGHGHGCHFGHPYLKAVDTDVIFYTMSAGRGHSPWTGCHFEHPCLRAMGSVYWALVWSRFRVIKFSVARWISVDFFYSIWCNAFIHSLQCSNTRSVLDWSWEAVELNLLQCWHYDHIYCCVTGELWQHCFLYASRRSVVSVVIVIIVAAEVHRVLIGRLESHPVTWQQ